MDKLLNRNGHDLTLLNVETRKGCCSICGEVDVAVAANNKGVRYWRCSQACGRKTNKTVCGKEHKLLSINLETREGLCFTCGSVKLLKAGKNKDGVQNWRCPAAVKKTAVPRKTNMKPREHFILTVNVECMTGICRKCGDVRVFRRKNAWKREDGWRCGKEMKERGIEVRTRPETKRSVMKANLKANYGLTIEQYEKMFENQEGKCSICNKHQSEVKPQRRLAVDHDHNTGKIRGLLCGSCNRGIGYFADSKEVVLAAALYLEKHSS